MTKIYISWAEFHQDTKALCTKIKASGEYNKIVAVSRGGLLPGGILSYELDIRDTVALCMSSYDGEKMRTDSQIELKGEIGDVDEHTLIVDDLSDSGRTYAILRQKFPQACYVCVYAKAKGASEVDIYAKDMPDEWIVFPWDL